jgi:hypothetical protein
MAHRHAASAAPSPFADAAGEPFDEVFLAL